ncbi:MAG: hypothetical protein CML68_13480 [Rhodobacteraceae bacterium]|nr:hypothetical protein [Paracoccaceae bacterium]
MNSNIDFAEQVQIVPAIVPVDLSSGANAGDWISMKNYERVTVVFFKGAGTAGDDPTVTLNEATAVDGTGSQTLAAIDKVYVKQGTLTSVGTFSVTTQAAAATYTDDTSAEIQALWVFDVMADDLSDGFDCLQISVADVGTNAQVGCALYLLWPPRYGEQALLSAIAD